MEILQEIIKNHLGKAVGIILGLIQGWFVLPGQNHFAPIFSPPRIFLIIKTINICCIYYNKTGKAKTMILLIIAHYHLRFAAGESLYIFLPV